ncbi:hypothetical protein C8J35_11521 [Rhizobium sp. PP-F2F-G38]|uniref:hypothetical protein n=1 Tax=Rhizobium sp. PP-CC-3G-465 TaxID=2135648 RepID=UPI000D9E64FD|nr:hypothetical protein C8J37_12724 [Rhizobium sp. PP-WC-1G-195]PYE93252.1 hypothetical protein C8J35_11521 [Rhizobium sp. PP-F2F-G38]TCP75073.1 hypothetical protein C8J31_13420 [Rhizobium sp. PP-CC-2G-626]TCQ16175.1 hypothetical protein C8J33_1178 [Rhizobium sp. PP-CC-3G-465]
MARKVEPRLMQESEIPAFVDAIIETGCDICACGDDLYTIGDADLSDENYEIAAPQLQAINQKFGDRDFLRREIVAYLRSLRRYLDSSEIDHWSQNVSSQ